VKEESHLEDMRAALRGDRERAEQSRQRSTENVLELIERPPAQSVQEHPERRSLLDRLLRR